MVKKHLVLVFCMLLLSTTMFSQETKFKALFMYNFTKYLEWPDERLSGEFVMSDITQELEIIAGKKKVGSQAIVVKEINSLSEISSCHILYVPENKSSKIEEILSNCPGKGTVLITDKPGLGSTISCLNYVKVDGKLSFEINKTNLEKQGIIINSGFLSLGIVIQ